MRTTRRVHRAHAPIPGEGMASEHRWIVSYADLLTLLMAFFVVMYAMSSVNENKYRLLTQSLHDVFDRPPGAPVPIDLGGSPAADAVLEALQEAANTALPNVVEPLQTQVPSATEETQDEPTETEAVDREGRMQALREQAEQGGGRFRETTSGVELELDASLLFASGRADLKPEAVQWLQGIGQELDQFPGRIEVEGHTDDQPIQSAIYPSNWELSGARAAAVVKSMLGAGLAPLRFAAIGYGQFRPVADNSTAEGRDRNRRVVIRLREQPEEQVMEELAAGSSGLGGLERVEYWPKAEGLRQ